MSDEQFLMHEITVVLKKNFRLLPVVCNVAQQNSITDKQ